MVQAAREIEAELDAGEIDLVGDAAPLTTDSDYCKSVPGRPHGVVRSHR
ncbi:MAG: hypothetical protein V5A34_03250 [Halapricum sp.]